MTSPRRHPLRPLRTVLQVLFFLALVALSALVVYPATRYLNARLASLLGSYLGLLEESVGARISYDSAGPALLSALDLRGVSLASPEGVRVVFAERLRINFSLFSLLREDERAFIRLVRVEGLEVNLDLERDRLFLERLAALAQTEGGENSFDPGKLLPERMLVRRSALQLASPTGELSLDALSLSLRSTARGFDVSGGAQGNLRQGAITRFEQALAPGLSSPGRVEGALTLEGTIDPLFAGAALSLGVRGFSSRDLVLAPQTLSLDWHEGLLELRSIKDRKPIDVFMSMDTRSGDMGLTLNTESLLLSRLVAFRGSMSSWSWLEKARLSSSVSLSRPAGALPELVFSLSARHSASPLLGSVRLDLGGNFDGDALAIRKATLSTAYGSAEAQLSARISTQTADGTISIQDLAPGGGEPLNGQLLLSAKPDMVDIFCEQLSMGALSLSAVNLALYPGKEDVEFQLSALNFPSDGDYDFSRLGRIAVEGSFVPRTSYLDLSIALDSISASAVVLPLLPLLGLDLPGGTLPALAQALHVTTEVFLSTDFKHVSWSAPRFVAAFTDPFDIFFVTSVFGNDARFSFDDINVIWRGGTASGNLSFDFTDPQALAFRSYISSGGLVWRLNGLYLDGNTLSLDGDYKLMATIMTSDESGISGSLSFENLPLPLLDAGLANLSCSTSFRYRDRGDWLVELASLDLMLRPALLDRSIQLSSKGRFTPSGGQLRDLYFDDGFMPLYGTAGLDWPAGFASTSFDLALSDALMQERYDLDGHVKDGQWSLRLFASKAQLSRFPVKELDGVLNAECRVQYGSRDDFSLDLLLNDSSIRYRGQDVRSSLSLHLEEDSLALSAVRAVFQGLMLDIPTLTLNRDTGALSAVYTLKGLLAGYETLVSGAVDASFGPLPSLLAVPSSLSPVEGTARFDTCRFSVMDIDPFGIRFSTKQGGVSVSGGPDDSFQFTMNAAGDFFARLLAPLPLQGSLSGSLIDGRIQAGTRSLSVDVPALFMLLPATVVSCSSGQLVVDLDVSGPVGDPEFQGRARARDLVLGFPRYVAEPVIFPQTELLFDGNELSFGPVTVTAGSGIANGQGVFRFDRWIPNTFSISLTMDPANPVPALVGVIGIQYRGLAAGRLSIDRYSDYFSLSGDLLLSNSVISLDAEALADKERDKPDSRPVVIDLGLRTGRKVEFLWPSDQFPVLRAYADSNKVLKIVYDGFSDKYSLVGDISLRGGEVFYFQRSFYLREGLLSFKENELDFDPELSVRAEIRDRNDQGPVVISLVADRAPLSRFAPRFESRPALSQVEIVSLLGQNIGMPGSSGESVSIEEIVSSTVTTASDIFAQFYFIRMFERQVRDVMNLDMFSVRTQVLQNAVLGAAYNAVGLQSEELDRRAGLGNYFDNTTVYMGKFIAPELFSHVMLTMQLDETKTNEPFGGLEIVPDIGIEMNTPLFMLKWNFMPEDPEKLFDIGEFFSDNSFSIFWSRSF